MSRTELLARAARLAERGEPFVLATVVRRTPPSSARPGNKALVEGDGALHGWLGGSCIEPVVRREAADALESGDPRLLVFAPDPDRIERPGVRAHPMTCHSGGTVEVYLEPELPAPLLCLFGDSPVSRALAEMAGPLGWRVRAVGGVDELEALDVDGPQGAPRRYAVVATMGEWDEAAVERALAEGFGYVGMVGSPRRAAEVRRTLGLAPDDDRLVSPAGLDVGARAPAEIAVTILAEILQRRSRPDAPEPAAGDAAHTEGTRPSGAAGVATDPVCGMEVAVDEAAATARHEEVTYHFCADGCRRRFEEEPTAWL